MHRASRSPGHDHSSETEHAMQDDDRRSLDLREVGKEMLSELTRRVQDIANSHCAVAGQMRQFQVPADATKCGPSTRRRAGPVERP